MLGPGDLPSYLVGFPAFPLRASEDRVPWSPSLVGPAVLDRLAPRSVPPVSFLPLPASLGEFTLEQVL